MSFRQNPNEMTYEHKRTSALSAFMSRVYMWMTVGILITACVAYGVGQNQELAMSMIMNKPFFYGLLIVQFLAVIGLMTLINRMSPAAAGITFIAYSALTGLTLSTIFLIYTPQNIAGIFLTTAFAFGGLSIFGYTTKRDLGPIGSFCMMGLFGLIGMMLLSFFIPSLNSDAMQMTYSVIGLAVFSGLTAYDTQRIKSFIATDAQTANRQAILGALVLYLDFLNLFNNLLRIMGGRR
mgnify:CR=1 FL=1